LPELNSTEISREAELDDEMRASIEASLEASENAGEPATLGWPWTVLPRQVFGVHRDTVRKRLLPLASKGGLAIIDQGLISGSNFALSILLARWLGADQYGAYAVAFGIFVLLSLVYQALVLEPMAVFGGSSYHHCLKQYLSTLLRIHLVISVSLCVVLGVSAVVLHGLSNTGGLAGAMAGVTIASPCVLVFGLARRMFYLELSPAEAAAGSFIYCCLIMAALFVAFHRGLLSPFTAFLFIALGAFGTGVAMWIRMRAKLPAGDTGPTLAETWSRHWGYGKWALASSVAGWIPANIYYPLISSFHGMAASGQLKALMNLTLPLEQVKAALSMLFLPYAARVAARKGASGPTALTTQMTFLAFAGALVYWAFILPFPKQVFQIMYSGKYQDVVGLLPIVAVGSIVWSAAYGPAIALRGMEAPDLVFKAFAVATIGSLVIGVPATWYFGLKGAIWGGNLADFSSLIMVFVVLKRRLRERAAQAITSETLVSGDGQPS